MLSRFHPARQTLRVATLALCAALMTGCQSFNASSVARVRVIDLSADAGTLDIYQAGHAIASNLAYGAVTSYVTLPSGSSTMSVTPAGSKQTLSSAKATLLSGGQYTLLVDNSLATLRQTLLTDQPPASLATIRLIHRAERTGPVDVYVVSAGHRLASTAPIAANLAPGATGYLPVPEGVATAIILPAGTRPSATAPALHTGRQILYLHGSARTLILLDASPTLTRSLDVIETGDGEPLD